MKIIDKCKKLDELNHTEAPYYVWHLFGENSRVVLMNGSEQISLGEDYVSIDQVRNALEWYVEEFGGKVKW